MLKDIKRFYGFLMRYKRDFFLFVLVMTSTTILENIIPYVYKLLVDAAPRGNYNELTKMVFWFVGLKILVNALSTLGNYLELRFVLPASRNARIMIFKRIQDLDFAFHVNKSTGFLISTFKRGDNAFYDLSHSINHHIFRIVVGLIVVLFLFNQITPIIAWLMLIVFIVNTLAGWQLVKFNISKRKDFNDAEDRVSGIITDNFINYETVKFFAQEEKEESRLKEEFQDWMKKIWAYTNSFRLMDISIGTLSNLGILAIFQIVIRKLSLGEITTGDLVMVISLMNAFYYRFFDLLYEIREIVKQQTDIHNYFDILDNEILIKDPEIPAQVKDIKGRVQFQQVSFMYPDNQQNVLNNVNLDIQPGESIAFIGRSGAGKTTLIKLLLRFYDVSQGEILIDGIDIRNFTKAQLRSFIGVVPQEPILFNNTIGFNVAYGKNKATQLQIQEACHLANLDEFIESLPSKYETEVGERGIKLSGGQKQRLAIARMILSNPKIIVFDEGTSNLDSESEHLIQDALWKVAKNRTVLIIAHRFSTVRKVDRAIVMDKGEIIESGTHAELMKKAGLYSYLREMQYQDQKFIDPNPEK